MDSRLQLRSSDVNSYGDRENEETPACPRFGQRVLRGVSHCWDMSLWFRERVQLSWDVKSSSTLSEGEQGKGISGRGEKVRSSPGV